MTPVVAAQVAEAERIALTIIDQLTRLRVDGSRSRLEHAVSSVKRLAGHLLTVSGNLEMVHNTTPDPEAGDHWIYSREKDCR